MAQRSTIQFLQFVEALAQGTTGVLREGFQQFTFSEMIEFVWQRTRLVPAGQKARYDPKIGGRILDANFCDRSLTVFRPICADSGQNIFS
jgi:hypothetical protein